MLKNSVSPLNLAGQLTIAGRIKNLTLFFLAIGVSLLTACSGHPSAGKWVAVDSNEVPYTRISVDFDGKAAIYPADQQSPTLNCYWQASSAETIDIQCGSSDQEEGTLLYTLEVSEQNLAILKYEDTVVGQFNRLP